MSGKGINFGIDFEGGTRITAPLRAARRRSTRSATRSRRSGLADAKIQTLRTPELGQQRRPDHDQGARPEGRSTKSSRRAAAKFGLADQAQHRADRPELRPDRGQARRSYAIIASLLIISIYIALRFEWKFAVPVLIALMHDILIVAGVYALVGREVTTSTVAALLTILGYSLYDTIIVFDRVRENIPRMPSAAFSQIVNRSLSEVIVRSLATSFCTLLPVLALMLFGGETLRDFAFALLIGIASGTYSSIFIATPVLQHWKEREPGFRARRARILRDARRRARRTPPRRRAARSTSTPEAQQRPPSQHLGAARPGRLAPASSRRWCAISASRRPPSPRAQPAARAGRARPAAGAPAPAPTAARRRRRHRAAAAPDRRGRRAPRTAKPRNRTHGRPR